MSQLQVPPVAITTGRETQGQAEARLPTQAEVDDYEREATELGAYQERQSDVRNEEHASSARYYPVINKQQTSRDKATWLQAVSTFWTRYIRLSVPHEDCRDHLGRFSAVFLYKCYFSATGSIFCRCTRTCTELTTIQRMRGRFWHISAHRLRCRPAESLSVNYFDLLIR